MVPLAAEEQVLPRALPRERDPGAALRGHVVHDLQVRDRAALRQPLPPQALESLEAFEALEVPLLCLRRLGAVRRGGRPGHRAPGGGLRLPLLRERRELRQPEDLGLLVHLVLVVLLLLVVGGAEGEVRDALGQELVDDEAVRPVLVVPAEQDHAAGEDPGERGVREQHQALLQRRRRPDRRVPAPALAPGRAGSPFEPELLGVRQRPVQRAEGLEPVVRVEVAVERVVLRAAASVRKARICSARAMVRALVD